MAIRAPDGANKEDSLSDTNPRNSISLNGNSCSAESINKYICSGLGISWARSLCDNWYKSNNGKESGFKIQPSFNHPENPLEELTDGTSHFVFFLIRTLNTVPASRKVISNGSSEGKGRLQVEKICKPLYFDTNWLLSHYFKSPGYGDILYLRGNFGKQLRHPFFCQIMPFVYLGKVIKS